MPPSHPTTNINSPPQRGIFSLLSALPVSFSNIMLGRLYPSLRPYLPQSSTHLTSKTAIITGANSGLGLQMAKDLVRLGANVTLACRNMEKGRVAVNEILSMFPEAEGRVQLRQLDTSNMDSVRAFASGFIKELDANARLDILMNNAGIATVPAGAKSDYTGEGYELTYATNFLGAFLLTSLLEGILAEDARVVFTSSIAQYAGGFGRGFSTGPVKNEIEKGFHVIGPSNGSMRYGMTKSMQVAFARRLQMKWDGKAEAEGCLNRRVAHSFTPGYVTTEIFEKFEVAKIWKDPLFAALKSWQVMAIDAGEGAATGSWLASTNDEKVVGIGMGGGYWDRMVRRTVTADTFKLDVLDRLWTRWEADAGIKWN